MYWRKQEKKTSYVRFCSYTLKKIKVTFFSFLKLSNYSFKLSNYSFKRSSAIVQKEISKKKPRNGKKKREKETVKSRLLNMLSRKVLGFTEFKETPATLSWEMPGLFMHEMREFEIYTKHILLVLCVTYISSGAKFRVMLPFMSFP